MSRRSGKLNLENIKKRLLRGESYTSFFPAVLMELHVDSSGMTDFFADMEKAIRATAGVDTHQQLVQFYRYAISEVTRTGAASIKNTCLVLNRVHQLPYTNQAAIFFNAAGEFRFSRERLCTSGNLSTLVFILFHLRLIDNAQFDACARTFSESIPADDVAFLEKCILVIRTEDFGAEVAERIMRYVRSDVKDLADIEATANLVPFYAFPPCYQDGRLSSASELAATGGSWVIDDVGKESADAETKAAAVEQAIMSLGPHLVEAEFILRFLKRVESLRDPGLVDPGLTVVEEEALLTFFEIIQPELLSREVGAILATLESAINPSQKPFSITISPLAIAFLVNEFRSTKAPDAYSYCLFGFIANHFPVLFSQLDSEQFIAVVNYAFRAIPLMQSVGAIASFGLVRDQFPQYFQHTIHVINATLTDITGLVEQATDPYQLVQIDCEPMRDAVPDDIWPLFNEYHLLAKFLLLSKQWLDLNEIGSIAEIQSMISLRAAVASYLFSLVKGQGIAESVKVLTDRLHQFSRLTPGFLNLALRACIRDIASQFGVDFEEGAAGVALPEESEGSEFSQAAAALASSLREQGSARAVRYADYCDALLADEQDQATVNTIRAKSFFRAVRDNFVIVDLAGLGCSRAYTNFFAQVSVVSHSRYQADIALPSDMPLFRLLRSRLLEAILAGDRKTVSSVTRFYNSCSNPRFGYRAYVSRARRQELDRLKKAVAIYQALKKKVRIYEQEGNGRHRAGSAKWSIALAMIKFFEKNFGVSDRSYTVNDAWEERLAMFLSLFADGTSVRVKADEGGTSQLRAWLDKLDACVSQRVVHDETRAQLQVASFVQDELTGMVSRFKLGLSEKPELRVYFPYLLKYAIDHYPDMALDFERDCTGYLEILLRDAAGYDASLFKSLSTLVVDPAMYFKSGFSKSGVRMNSVVDLLRLGNPHCLPVVFAAVSRKIGRRSGGNWVKKNIEHIAREVFTLFEESRRSNRRIEQAMMSAFAKMTWKQRAYILLYKKGSTYLFERPNVWRDLPFAFFVDCLRYAVMGRDRTCVDRIYTAWRNKCAFYQQKMLGSVRSRDADRGQYPVEHLELAVLVAGKLADLEKEMDRLGLNAELYILDNKLRELDECNTYSRGAASVYFRQLKAQAITERDKFILGHWQFAERDRLKAFLNQAAVANGVPVQESIALQGSRDSDLQDAFNDQNLHANAWFRINSATQGSSARASCASILGRKGGGCGGAAADNGHAQSPEV